MMSTHHSLVGASPSSLPWIATYPNAYLAAYMTPLGLIKNFWLYSNRKTFSERNRVSRRVQKMSQNSYSCAVNPRFLLPKRRAIIQIRWKRVFSKTLNVFGHTWNLQQDQVKARIFWEMVNHILQTVVRQPACWTLFSTQYLTSVILNLRDRTDWRRSCRSVEKFRSKQG